MSEPSQIDHLLAEVQKLRDTVQPLDRDSEFKAMEAEMMKARLAANVAQRERDEAVEELARIKTHVAWTMDKLKIKDLLRPRGTGDIPCAAEGFLPLWSDPRDTERIEWINKHGRACLGQDSWVIAFPHHLRSDSAVPDIYNVRDIIDVARLCSAETGRQDGDPTGEPVAE